MKNSARKRMKQPFPFWVRIMYSRAALLQAISLLPVQSMSLIYRKSLTLLPARWRGRQLRALLLNMKFLAVLFARCRTRQTVLHMTPMRTLVIQPPTILRALSWQCCRVCNSIFNRMDRSKSPAVPKLRGILFLSWHVCIFPMEMTLYTMLSNGFTGYLRLE